jgi:hypothetical protein
VEKKLYVGTGWYSSVEPLNYETYGDDIIRTPEFRRIWWKGLGQYLKPDLVVLVDSASPVKPNDDGVEYCPVKTIELTINPGHSQVSSYHYCGWSASVILSMEYAYLDGADIYVYVEQDVLLHSPNILNIINNEFQHRSYIFGDGSGTPQLLQQSLFAIDRKGMRVFLSKLHGIDEYDKNLSPETKFHIATTQYVTFLVILFFIRLKFNSFALTKIKNNFISFLLNIDKKYMYWPFGYGRNRPINFSDEDFYFQHGSCEEISAYIKKTMLVDDF